MGYLSKELLQKAYETLSMLTEDHKQGQTQTTSIVRHLFALDMFYKDNGENCDLSDSDNKAQFVENVKCIVNIENDYYTTNFYTNIKQLEDCGVGSNFYSAGVVNNSKQNTTYTYSYPTRGQSPVFNVKNNVLIWNEDFLKNIRTYLFSENIRAAFAIWILRDKYLKALDKESRSSRDFLCQSDLNFV